MQIKYRPHCCEDDKRRYYLLPKGSDYHFNTLFLKNQQKNGFNEAIFINEKGYICEGCTSNIFMIKDKIIYTPDIRNGLLPGIIRKWIIDNFEVIEKNITKEELLNSDELFFTNSLVGVIKCAKIGNKNFNCKITQEIKEQYEKAINGGAER